MAFEYIESAVRTDVGRSRKQNEDSVLALPEHGVFCVADGIGGAAGGAMASAAVADAIRQAFAARDAHAETTLDENITTLREAVLQADRTIKAWADAHASAGTGTTLVAFVFDPVCAFFGSVLHAGDSRAYRFRQGLLTRLSNDHSMANALGLDNEDDVPAAYHGVITHAIGTQEATLEENTFDVEDGDLFLLCSDGLTRMVTDIELEALLFRHREEMPSALAARLVDRANAAGGADNISVAVIRSGRPVGAPPSAMERAPLRKAEEAANEKPMTTEKAQAIAGPKPPADPPPKAEAPAPGRSPSVCWRTWRGVAGVLLVAALGLAAATLAIRCSRSRASEGVAAAGRSEEEATSADEGRLPSAEARRRVVAALESGEWGALRWTLGEELSEIGGRLSVSSPEDRRGVEPDRSEKVRYDDMYRSWLYLWQKVRYTEWPATNRAEYLAYCNRMQDVQQKLEGTTPLGIRREWPASQEAQADFVCRESYRLQRSLLDDVVRRMDAYDRRLAVFREDRPLVLEALCSLGTGGEECVEQMGASLVAVESKILALRKWIEMRGTFPLDPDVLGELAEAMLPALDRGMDRLGELLHRNLVALSAQSLREVCGAQGISESEIENLLLLRDRLAAPHGTLEDAAAWWAGVNTEQLKFFVRRLVRKCPAP